MDNPVFVHNEDIPHIDDDDNYEDQLQYDTLTQAGLKKRHLLNSQPKVRLKPAQR